MKHVRERDDLARKDGPHDAGSLGLFEVQSDCMLVTVAKEHDVAAVRRKVSIICERRIGEADNDGNPISWRVWISRPFKTIWTGLCRSLLMLSS